MESQFEKYTLDAAQSEAMTIQEKAKKRSGDEEPGSTDYLAANDAVNEERRLFQGEKTSLVFRGEGRTETVREVYGESAGYFSNIFRAKIKDKDVEHTLIDFGCHKGELLQNILDQLKDYRFYTIGVDTEVNLQENNIVQEKVPGSLTNIPLEGGSVECGMMRYVLQWNSPENQKKILQEISRVVKDFIIVQHAGSDNVSPKEYREKFDKLFRGEQVKKLKRSNCFFSSQNEVEEILNESGINFELLLSKRIEKVSNVFIERFGLSEQEAEAVRSILGDKDYVMQTTWLLEPDK